MKLVEKYQQVFKVSGFITLVVLFTCPPYWLDLNEGLDSGYFWALNELFWSDYNQLTDLIYPLGPLGLLLSPTYHGNSVLYSAVFFLIIKASFILLTIRLNTSKKQDIKLHYVLIFLAAYFLRIDNMLIFLCVLLHFFYLKERNKTYYLLSSLIALLGLFIKSSIGFGAILSYVVFIGLNFYLHRKPLEILQQLITLIGAYLLIGFLVLGDFTKIFTYGQGVLKLISGYSSLAIYPDNNWYVLTTLIILIALFPFISKNKQVRYIYILLLPSLFTMWKHGMSRESITHNALLLYYLVVYWSIILLVAKKKTFFLMAYALVAILLFYSNMSNLINYGGYKIELSGINNFKKVFFETDSLKTQHERITQKAILPLKLDTIAKQLIGDKTIDIYPWNIMYVAANDLNWRVRPTLQSGAFSSWIDSVNAQYFTAEKGSELVLFHLRKGKNELDSFDDRYVLNDEPITVKTIFNHYAIIYKSSDFILLQKQKQALFTRGELSKNRKVAWGEWICIPKNEEKVTRVKVNSTTSWVGKLRNILFKEQAYYVDYELKDTVVTYRYVKDNAQDGLWLNPFITTLNYEALGEQINKVRFRSVDSLFTGDSLNIQFETITFDSTIVTHKKYHPFTKNRAGKYTPFYNYLINFDNYVSTKTGIQYSKRDFSYSGDYSNKIPKEAFSYSLDFDLEKIRTKADTSRVIQITASVQFFANQKTESFLVFVLKNSEKDIWDARPLKNDTLGTWQKHSFEVKLNKELKSGEIQIYVWNNDKENTVYVDDLNVRFEQETQ